MVNVLNKSDSRMIPKICCICLNEAELKTLNKQDENQTQFSVMLQYIAPEHEWLEVFSICSKCTIQLHNAYQFKQLCFTNTSFRKEFCDYHGYSRVDKEDNEITEDLQSDSVSICEEIRTEFKEEFTNELLDGLNAKEQLDCSSSANVEHLICHHCDKPFKSKLILENHIRTMHQNICKLCTKTFITKKELRLHKKEEHLEEILTKFQCEICMKHFSLLKNILKHCTEVHSMSRKDIKPYHCNECSDKFSSSTLLIQHKKYHNGIRQFVCTICGKAFITGRDLNGHEKLHENQRGYSCDKCDKSFNTSQNLKTHIYVVHTDPSHWKHSCPVCSKRFAMKANFNEHVKRHQGSKDYVCHICKKGFVSNHEMKKHVKLHSNISPFKCTHCTKHYRDIRSMEVHLSKIHSIGTVKGPIKVKKFVCHICPSQFYDNPKLQRHLRTHTGVKPFSCQECDKRFIDKSYLSCHLKNVHNIVISGNKLHLNPPKEYF